MGIACGKKKKTLGFSQNSNSFNENGSTREIDLNYRRIPNKIHLGKTYLHIKKAGIVGLTNLGNTCFFNSAIQCLNNIQPLSDYLMNNLHLEEMNLSNPLGSKGEILKSYAELMQSMWKTKEKTINPQNFMKSLSKIAPQGTQEDAHEFITFLLDILHEDLNRVINKPYIETKDFTGKDYENYAISAWKDYLQRNKSIIVDLFQGQLKSTLECSVCSYKSHKFDCFMYLSIPVPQNVEKVNLEECIKEFTKGEILDNDEKWHCPNCNKRQITFKKIDIWKSPDILLIHLKRFSYTITQKGKITTKVLSPMTNLDLSDLIDGKQKFKPIYDLFAVTNHSGGLGSGHYTSFAKNKNDKNWYCFNDAYAQPLKNVKNNTFENSEIYMLFYSKTTIGDFTRQSISDPEGWPHIFEGPLKRKESKLKTITNNFHRK